MRNEQDSNFRLPLDHLQQVSVLEAFGLHTVVDRHNSSLAFLVAANWHVEEYTYADLSALAMLSAILQLTGKA